MNSVVVPSNMLIDARRRVDRVEQHRSPGSTACHLRAPGANASLQFPCSKPSVHAITVAARQRTCFPTRNPCGP